MYSGDVSTMSFPSSRCPMPTAEASHDRARSLALQLLNILVNTKKWTFVVICCSALAAAENRKKLKNSLWNVGTGELVDVSNGSYHWMYRSAGEHVARELLTYCYILKCILLVAVAQRSGRLSDWLSRAQMDSIPIRWSRRLSGRNSSKTYLSGRYIRAYQRRLDHVKRRFFSFAAMFFFSTIFSLYYTQLYFTIR